MTVSAGMTIMGASVAAINWTAAVSKGAVVGMGVADVPHPAMKNMERSRDGMKIFFI